MNEKTEAQITEMKNGCLGLLAALMCVPLAGWVITKLWGWYVVPFGIPQISVAHAIGIDLLMSYLTMHYTKSERSIVERIIISVGTPLMFLLFGWIISLFM